MSHRYLLMAQPNFNHKMAKMMSKKQMMKELKPTKQQLKKFHDQLKAHGLTKELLQQGRLDRQSEA